MENTKIKKIVEDKTTKKTKKKDKHYLSNKELKKIAKFNRSETRKFEKFKKRKNASEEEYVTTMRDEENIVEFDNLHTYFYTDAGTVKAVNGVSFDIKKGSVVGVVGESGCGKSVTSLSLMQLVQAPIGQTVSGSIRFQGASKTIDIAKTPSSEMCKIRGKEIAMIFQEPMTSLNPVFTVGNQLDEVALLHIPNITKEEAKKHSISMLDKVGIADASRVYSSYPHQLSGGMKQRVMIAMSISCNPKLIIADEPTTALDVTIQAQILELLVKVKEEIDGSIMLITHDLGVIAEVADEVVVMYAGKVIEKGTVYEIFDNPLHPYTIGLQKSKPVVNKKIDRLYSIPGTVPNPIELPPTCYFKDRCDKKFAKCESCIPHLIQVSKTHFVSCFLYDSEEGKFNGK